MELRIETSLPVESMSVSNGVISVTILEDGCEGGRDIGDMHEAISRYCEGMGISKVNSQLVHEAIHTALMQSVFIASLSVGS